MCISYSEIIHPVYNYRLDESYPLETELRPKENISTEFVSLDVEGNLLIRKGYYWDGMTGVLDTELNMRGSLVHDSFYQLMRERSYAFPASENRKSVDKLLREICIEDGVFEPIAWIYYFGVRKLASYAAKLQQ